MTYTTTTSNQDVTIAFGAHLARQNEWGPGKGAAAAPGASAKIYASLDGANDANVSINPGTAISAGGTISGTVYNDANGNGALDAGEVGIAGVAMALSGVPPRRPPRARTALHVLRPLGRDVRRRLHRADRFANTGTKPLTGVRATNTSTLTARNFFAQQRNASIAGTVYDDTNGNGGQDSGESASSG